MNRPPPECYLNPSPSALSEPHCFPSFPCPLPLFFSVSKLSLSQVRRPRRPRRIPADRIPADSANSANSDTRCHLFSCTPLRGPNLLPSMPPLGAQRGPQSFVISPSSGGLLLHCDHGLWVVTWRRSLTRCILSILPFLAVILFRNVTMALGRVLERKAGQLILSFTLRSSL